MSARASTQNYGDACAGGIALEVSFSGSEIENCTFSGKVSATHEGLYGTVRAGGITGGGEYQNYGAVKNCEVLSGLEISANAPNAADFKTDFYAGGIAGKGEYIASCISRAKISSQKYAGGIAGDVSLTSGVIGNKYSNAEYGLGATGTSYVPSDSGCEKISGGDCNASAFGILIFAFMALKKFHR